MLYDLERNYKHRSVIFKDSKYYRLKFILFKEKAENILTFNTQCVELK